ncbi:ferredoxin family protein [Methanobacterium sp. BAmetb5]|jgi:NAD-dependent dihydropyrimidine dehydrogenase PreA subunit|uniref:4Fe-4S dicluster domain-containing protein n=1 Tax=Methanobacterium sp. BAmetb5 TaxID=2025351 RepID=UPI000E8FD5C7|nr:4Fe-4S binding protein [Methanobacterium sp. BAmetb5]AXV38807.1 MAG: sulfite reductase [Methanobacterium sp. BAmetb5]
MPKIEIDQNLCTKCGTCVSNCPVSIFQRDDEDSIPQVIDPDNCILCGMCVDNCPEDAVKHENF